MRARRGLIIAAILIRGLQAQAWANIDLLFSINATQALYTSYLIPSAQFEVEGALRINDAFEFAAPLYLSSVPFLPSTAPLSFFIGMEVRYAPRLGSYLPSIGLGISYESGFHAKLSQFVPYVDCAPLRFLLARIPERTAAAGDPISPRWEVFVSCMKFRYGSNAMLPLDPNYLTSHSKNAMILTVDVVSVSLLVQ